MEQDTPQHSILCKSVMPRCQTGAGT